ncbi:hypothetical protein P3T76_002284 [Phytophthora citrophthora]|uniref:Uncharacterized protein n=1 Tax=Phytophthora citrophthora TaxID=4793 RepID=A0AAD9LTT0_9STRA|nr:hypothetical protein P3T76_002284 [Phytophthora citrophthora]
MAKVDFFDNITSLKTPIFSRGLERVYYCLLHTNSTVQCTRDDLFVTNSNFIDSGATINAVSPAFCQRAGLENKIEDHGVDILITLANKKEMKIRKRTLRMNLYIDSFPTYVDDFLVLPVPEEQDLLLGMPWLKATNPDIDWINETVKPRSGLELNSGPMKRQGSKKKKVKPKTTTIPSQPATRVGGKRVAVGENATRGRSRYFQHGYFSVTSGETKYITRKQFKRLMRKPQDIECVFVLPRKSKRKRRKH